jgi:hypothetical protein
MESMTVEDRIERMEGYMERIMGTIERQTTTIERIVDLTGQVANQSFAALDILAKKVNQLMEAQAQTNERLTLIAKLMQEWIRRNSPPSIN